VVPLCTEVEADCMTGGCRQTLSGNGTDHTSASVALSLKQDTSLDLGTFGTSSHTPCCAVRPSVGGGYIKNRATGSVACRSHCLASPSCASIPRRMYSTCTSTSVSAGRRRAHTNAVLLPLLLTLTAAMQKAGAACCSFYTPVLHSLYHLHTCFSCSGSVTPTGTGHNSNQL
jgi:hypothetical protein